MPSSDSIGSQYVRDIHIGKIQWIVNQAMGKQVFDTSYTQTVTQFMDKHKYLTIAELLGINDYSDFK
jgi:hypothetical protein